MQKQITYETPEGYKVIATFHTANVAWYIVGKPLSKGVDNIETFFKRAASRGWEEVK